MYNWELQAADRVMFSTESGKKIEPGESVFLGRIHGRDGVFLVEEGEKMLGLRDVSTEERKRLADKGSAMPDGSFPIANCSDAANAIHAIGRANPSKRGAVRAHIRRRVNALGCNGSTFENWR